MVRAANPLLNTREMRDSIDDFVESVQLEGRDVELVQAIFEESKALLAARRPRGTGMTADRAKRLVESGTYTEEQIARAEANIAEGSLARRIRETRLSTIHDSLSTNEAAERLGIEATSVRQRTSKKLLYSFLSGKNRRYPNWQFMSGNQGVLPHLASLVAEIPSDLHPAVVRGFMTTPKESLYFNAPSESGADKPYVTPAEWLAEGGSLDRVLSILDTYLKS